MGIPVDPQGPVKPGLVRPALATLLLALLGDVLFLGILLLLRTLGTAARSVAGFGEEENRPLETLRVVGGYGQDLALVESHFRGEEVLGEMLGEELDVVVVFENALLQRK